MQCVRRVSLGLLLAITGCRGVPPQVRPAVPIATAQTARRPPTTASSDTSPEPRSTVAIRQAAHVEPLPKPPALFSGPVPVEALVGYAVANHPEIAAARAKAEALLARVPQVRSLDDPMLTSTVFLEEVQTAAGPQDLALAVSQKLPWCGKLRARGGMAFREAQVAFAEMADVELAVVQRVKVAYFELYYIDRALAVYRELKPRIEEVVELARTRFETNDEQVGLETVLQAEVALDELEITVIQLEQAWLRAMAELSEALALPKGVCVDLWPLLEEGTLPHCVDVLVAVIDQGHPQLAARRQAILRDEWAIELARREYYPDVTLGFNWWAIGSTGLSGVANGRDAYALMVGVNLPIYQAKRDAALREARLKTASSARQYDATWDDLRALIQQFYAEAVEHERVLEILDERLVPKAQQTFDLSIEAWGVDRIGFQQLIDNYEKLLRFRIASYRRQSRREQAIARLERAAGTILAAGAGEGPEVENGAR